MIRVEEPIVLTSEDERTREREADTDFDDHVIKSWTRRGERADVECEDGTGCAPWWPETAPDAKPGDRVRIYGRFGSRLHGVALVTPDGLVPISYQTKREVEVEDASWIAEHNREQRREFAEHRDRLDAAYEALPDALKRRIDRFRAADPNFRWREEAYEMAACAEAGRLYRRAQDPAWGDAIRAHGIKVLTKRAREAKRSYYDATDRDLTTRWADTPENRLLAFDAINEKPNGYRYELQRELMPDMDDGHSGNTWGHAVGFALALLRGQGDRL